MPNADKSFFIQIWSRSLRRSLAWHGQCVQARNSSHCHIIVSSPISQKQAFRLPHPACASSRQCSRHDTGSAALVLLQWFVCRGHVREAAEETAHSHKEWEGQETPRVRHKDSPSCCRMLELQEAEGRGRSNRDRRLHWMECYVQEEEGGAIIPLREKQKTSWEKTKKRKGNQSLTLGGWAVVASISAIGCFVAVTADAWQAAWATWEAQPHALVSLSPAAVSADLSLHLHLCNEQYSGLKKRVRVFWSFYTNSL